MYIFAGSFYLASTAAFSILAIIIGIRLITLSRRTKRVPERSLGLGIMLTAGFGYGILMFAMIGRQAAGGSDAAPAFFSWLLALGWISHNAGVVFILDFVRRVFRPEERWARILEFTMGLVLWGGWIAYVVGGGLESNSPGRTYWIMFSVIGTYPLWTAIESIRYWKMMRKRVSLGLADPLVANRFLLWAIAAITTFASIWLVEAPTFLGFERFSPEAAHVTAISMLCTSSLGIATICSYWLTFFPPGWYSARFSPPAAMEREIQS